MWRALLLLGVAACGGPNRIQQDDFPAFAADIFCERLAECARGEFEKDFFGMDDCLAHLERDFTLIDASFEDCDYDDQGAADAWDHLASMSCEEFYEAEYLEDYDRVWDCT